MANELPILAFFRSVLDPFIIWGLLVLLTWIYNEDFTGHYLVLVIITFFISSYVYEQTAIYKNWRNGRLLVYIRDTLLGWGIIIAALMFLGFATKYYDYYSGKVILAWFIMTPITLIASHLLARLIMTDIRKKGEARSSVIIGLNETSLRFIQHITDNPFLLIENQGFFDERLSSRVQGNFGKRLGSQADALPYINEHNIKMVLVSLPLTNQPRIQKMIDELQDTATSVYFLPDTHFFDLMKSNFYNIGHVPVMVMNDTPFTGVNGVVKNVSDFMLAIFFLILLLPFMLCIAVAVKITSPGPIIFKQRRYGVNGEEIIVYKFRSMTVNEDGANIVQAKKNDQRITKLGAFLRRTSLDELPQFINVLQGRMSLVGPRPHAVAHNELYRKLIKGYMLRHMAKPGITGWAQVNGWRGETEELDKMKARIEHDLHYLQNWSLWLDLWIILRTVWVVLRRDNAH